MNDAKSMHDISFTGSALKNSKIFSTAELPRATGWKQEALQERFVYMRDVRFLHDSDGDLRRSSWMYPDDGCYARAALAMRNLFKLYAPLPSKVFAFGNLKVVKKNSTRGAVYWWYHFAPIVQIKVSICGSGTYSPGDRCDRESDGPELRAERAQLSYLREEEKRLLRLGRETTTELGDTPPWLGSQGR